MNTIGVQCTIEIMRHIPAVMATQHPDNAQAPFWESDGDGFVSSQEEVQEAYSAYETLNVDEYMWDWEGKYVDEAVVERLLNEYHSFFAQHQLGKDKFLTFRIPNIWEEKGYSLARAFMAILTAADMARDLKLHGLPLFEVILPMTTSAQQLLHIQKTFTQLARVKHKLFEDRTKAFEYIEIIPLLEGVDHMFNIGRLLEQYRKLHAKLYKHSFPYIRPFLARSDPALLAGLIPAVVANKVALSQMYQWGEKHSIDIYPIVGVGSLPFRGSCSPDTIDKFIEEYKGVRTVTVQSAFRYDYPLKQVKHAIKTLQTELPKQAAQYFTPTVTSTLRNIIKRAEKHYQQAITDIAPDILRVSAHIPRRRERRLHIGLLGYGRSIGKQAFPRAINFTASLYSLGVPPELIGTGRTLRSMSKEEGELLHMAYHNLEHDIKRAGRYLNKENLAHYAKRDRAWKNIAADIAFLEDYFGTTLEPKTTNEFLHRNATSNIYYLLKQRKPIDFEVLQSGILRQSLG